MKKLDRELLIKLIDRNIVGQKITIIHNLVGTGRLITVFMQGLAEPVMGKSITKSKYDAVKLGISPPRRFTLNIPLGFY